MSNLAIEVLIQKREQLMAELQEHQDRIGAEIKAINTAVVAISGKTIPEIETEYRYQDENSDYIKGTEDGI